MSENENKNNELFPSEEKQSLEGDYSAEAQSEEPVIRGPVPDMEERARMSQDSQEQFSYQPPYNGYQTGEQQSGQYQSGANWNAYNSYNKQSSGFEYPQGAPAVKPPKKKRSKGGIAALIVVLCLVLLVGSIAIVGALISGNYISKKNFSDFGSISEIASIENEPQGDPDGPDMSIEKMPNSNSSASKDGKLTAEEVYDVICDSSVSILVYQKDSQYLANEGTGVILGEDANNEYTYIITCAHVVSGADISLIVKLSDSTKEFEATIVGYDVRTDIGVIKIKASGLKAASFADSADIKVGQTVYAIGNPGGSEFAGSFTNGIVSALSRPISSSTGYTMKCIQHNAAINPGNSGGALVNEYGYVIGINSMKIVDTDFEGMGFAVPSSIVKEVVDQLIANGYVPNRPKIGISYREASYYSGYNMVLRLRNLPTGSIVIEQISSDSPLKNTEAQVYDMIVAVNGVDMDSPNYLREVIEKSKVGDKLVLSLVRVSKDYSVYEFDITVTLVEDKGTTVIPETTTEQAQSSEDFNFEEFFGGDFDFPF